MKFMSFDISSTTTGWAVFNVDKKNNIKLLDSGFFKPSKNGDIFERLASVRADVNSLLKTFKPEEVAIEDITQFMPKMSSANTIITLALFNRTIGLAVYDFLNKSPHLYSVMAIRHGIKQTADLPKKEEIPALVESLLGVSLPRQYKKNGTPKDELHDEADAIAVGLFHAYKITNKLESLKSSRKKK
jgi:Holliday junction resolvasome RuvABC endonuclease subunit